MNRRDFLKTTAITTVIASTGISINAEPKCTLPVPGAAIHYPCPKCSPEFWGDDRMPALVIYDRKLNKQEQEIVEDYLRATMKKFHGIAET